VFSFFEDESNIAELLPWEIGDSPLNSSISTPRVASDRPFWNAGAILFPADVVYDGADGATAAIPVSEKMVPATSNNPNILPPLGVDNVEQLPLKGKSRFRKRVKQ
jgi:hypothetical protein